jgi:hypothetical protein
MFIPPLDQLAASINHPRSRELIGSYLLIMVERLTMRPADGVKAGARIAEPA